MADENDLAGALKTLTKTSDEVYAKVCEVLEIDQDEKTINVKPVDDTAEIYNVRLQAESESGGLVLFPKVGSMVLVVFINKNNAAVVNTSEIEKLDLVIEGVNLQIDKDGFLLKKENETLKKLMVDLIMAIKALKFTTNTGSTIQLVNIQDFIAIEKRCNNFFK
jgi:exosome complex RNA-binding protein Csl4